MGVFRYSLRFIFFRRWVSKYWNIFLQTLLMVLCRPVSSVEPFKSNIRKNQILEKVKIRQSRQSISLNVHIINLTYIVTHVSVIPLWYNANIQMTNLSYYFIYFLVGCRWLYLRWVVVQNVPLSLPLSFSRPIFFIHIYTLCRFIFACKTAWEQMQFILP